MTMKFCNRYFKKYFMKIHQFGPANLVSQADDIFRIACCIIEIV